jgi:hypothetical protein
MLSIGLPYISGSQPGVRVPLGVHEKLTGGTPNKKTLKNMFIWVGLLIWGVCEGDTVLIWGYAEGYNPDLGVREYQKVENPCRI